MLKPSWMTTVQYEDFKRTNPIITCRLCGSTDIDRMTIDHIIARAKGGTDDISNLQWACDKCNRNKGVSDDPYWSRSFYFDREISLEGLRCAHRQECWERLLSNADWFGRPFSQISRFLYTLAWVVGSGKTIAAAILAFGLNFIIRRDCGSAAPRVNRLLILCKEQAIRDQIALDLSVDLKRFGICSANPRVLLVTEGSQLSPSSALDQFDIVVACIQNLWTENEQPRKDLQHILSAYPLIAIDEPHFGADQVLRIVEAASCSLVFGLTSTPIDANGDQIKKFIRFSVYDYQTACENDQSLKFLVGPKDEQWSEIFEELDIDAADMHRNGKREVVTSAKERGYDINLRPVISVAESVVRYIRALDGDHALPISGLFGRAFRAAEHRPTLGVNADLVYPGHAMIRVETVAIGHFVTDHLNKMFEGNRAMFPPSDGWRAEIVHSDVQDFGGKLGKGLRLTTDHAWMYAKNHDGRVSKDAARIIVVVGIGREGVHNPYCCCVGLACRAQSLVENVQRAFGRQLRALIEYIGELLRVPPSSLDTIKIITHLTFGNRPFVEASADYLLDMADALSSMPSLEALKSAAFDAQSFESVDPEAILLSKEKLGIAAVIGGQRLMGIEGIDPTPIVSVFGGPTASKRQKVVDWITTITGNPAGARQSLHLEEELQEVPRVLRERLTVEPTDEELRRFILREKRDLADFANRLDNSDFRRILTSIYADYARKFHLSELPASMSITDIHRRLARRAEEKVGAHYKGPSYKFFPLTGTAIQMVLGTAGVKDSLKAKGQNDTPECHAILTRPEVQERIIGWVVRTLISKGYCPELAAALCIPQEEGVEVSRAQD